MEQSSESTLCLLRVIQRDVMLRSSGSSSGRRFPFSPPGRSRWQEGVLLQGHPRPWPFAKLRTLWVPAHKVQGTKTDSAVLAFYLAFSLGGARASCHLRHSVPDKEAVHVRVAPVGGFLVLHSRAGSARRQRPGSRQSRQPRLRRRSSKVSRHGVSACLSTDAIPPASASCRCAPLAEASGHPWCGPLGRWRSVCQSSSREVQTVVLDLFLSGLPVTPCAGWYASALRRCAFVRGTVPVSGDRYLPHQRRCVAHAGRAVPARALEAVCLPHGAPVFVGVREPKVSRPWSRQSPPPTGLRCQTASKAIPSAALRGLVGLETLALGPAARSSTIPTTSPAPVTRPRDSKPTRSTRNPRSGGSAYGSGVPRSGDGN